MKIEDYLPVKQLRPFVKGYKIIESKDGIVNRVIPATSFTLAFRLSGEIAYLHKDVKEALPTTLFSGLQKSSRLIEYSKDSSTLIVLFSQQGATSFFREPLHQLFEKSIAMDCLVSQPDVSRIEQRLVEEVDNRSKITLVEQFLIARLLNTSPDKVVSEAISNIHFANGNLRIKELANQLYISQDAFEKRFRKATGATPKQFAHIVKMNNVVRQATANPTFLDMAFENGYCDQPHFNKDFKIFTGQTPTDFFRSPQYW